MRAKLKAELEELALDCLEKYQDSEDALTAQKMYLIEVERRYDVKEDGPLDSYREDALDIFFVEAFDEKNPRPLLEEVAENMSIYVGAVDDTPFLPRAAHLLRMFEAIEGRPAADYLEIEEWSRHHLDKSHRFLVLQPKD